MKPEQAPGKPLPDNGAKWPRVWLAPKARSLAPGYTMFAHATQTAKDFEAWIPEAQAQADKAEAVAAAFDAVLVQAEKIYQEEIDSDPSDYFYTKRAVMLARESAAGGGT